MKYFLIGCALTILVYAPWLDFGMIGTFDDAGYITNHKVVQDWWGSSWQARLLTPEIGYPIPLPAAIYVLSRWIALENSELLIRGFGLLAHLAGGFFAFGIARRILHSRIENHVELAAALATIWMLHPTQAESVMWLSNLKSTFSVASVLGVLWFSMRFLEGGRALNGVGALLMFAIGLASKPTAIVALPMVAALPLFWPDSKATLKRLLPIIISASMIGGTVALVAFGDHGDFAKVSTHVNDSWGFRTQQGLLALGVLARIIFFPLGLGPNYTHPPEIAWYTLLPGALILAVALAGTAWAWRSGRRDLVGALTLTALAWAPYSHVVFLPRFAADTYASLPLFGVLLMLGLLARRPKPALVASLGIVVVALTLTTLQAQRWEDGESLWGPELKANPLSVAALQHVSYAQFQRGDADLAVQTIQEHYAAFRTHARYPVWIGELFLTKDPILALNFATEAAIHSAKNQLTDNHYFLFLRALAAAQVGLPDHPDVQKVYRDAKALYDQKPEWQKVIQLH